VWRLELLPFCNKLDRCSGIQAELAANSESIATAYPAQGSQGVSVFRQYKSHAPPRKTAKKILSMSGTSFALIPIASAATAAPGPN
jgi:hypothetical protein